MDASSTEPRCPQDHLGCSSRSCVCACHGRSTLESAGAMSEGNMREILALNGLDDLEGLDDLSIEDLDQEPSHQESQGLPRTRASREELLDVTEQLRASQEELLRSQAANKRRLDEAARRRREEDRRWGRDRRAGGPGRSL